MTNTPINVVMCAPLLGNDLAPVRALEPAINVIDANEAFSAYGRALNSGDTAKSAELRAPLDAILAQADVVCMSFPMLRDVAASAPKLRWLHHTNAGVSNLYSCDVWTDEQITLTSGRGHVRPTAMAEYSLAGAMLFARGLHDAYLDKPNAKLDRSHYRPVRLEGSTIGIVGLGGIGRETARLAKVLGMRVIGTRRSVTKAQHDVDNADLVLPAGELLQMVAESDFVAVCCQLTDETFHLMSREVFAVMKPAAVVTNISRGEVIDEEALIEALAQGRIRGAVLDVYEGEMNGKPPRPELWESPNVVLTPHISATGGADTEMMSLFVENLGRYVAGEPLLNLVDRARGY
ncbi:MAG TPA: NAD(P)-dependent oxidoreductase [Dehalococcoidia bacterium]|nr:NAD(P)-dependent oxidoreductase [Dehalococcoidia bacterium]